MIAPAANPGTIQNYADLCRLVEVCTRSPQRSDHLRVLVRIIDGVSRPSCDIDRERRSARPTCDLKLPSEISQGLPDFCTALRAGNISRDVVGEAGHSRSCISLFPRLTVALQSLVGSHELSKTSLFVGAA